MFRSQKLLVNILSQQWLPLKKGRDNKLFSPPKVIETFISVSVQPPTGGQLPLALAPPLTCYWICLYPV